MSDRGARIAASAIASSRVYRFLCAALDRLGARSLTRALEHHVLPRYPLHRVPRGPLIRRQRRVRADVPKTVLCYLPYATFTLHAVWESLLIHAIHLRGHRTEVVLCDGIFAQCDVFRMGSFHASALGPDAEKSHGACRECRLCAQDIMAALDTPSSRIGARLTVEERQRAAEWSKTLQPEDFHTAQWEDWPIGAWVVSSVHSHFRTNEIDLSKPGVVTIFRRYLAAGLCAAFALDRLLEETRPDLLLVFNGRMSSTRVALELARRRGVRVISEERARVPGHIRLVVNNNCLHLGDLDMLWERWRGVPLSSEELGCVTALLADRRVGRSFEVRPFSPPSQETSAVRAALSLDDRPVWVLFTSSIDESALEPRARGLFRSQNAWVEAVVDYAGRNPDIQLVIRVHPNVGSGRSIGRNEDDAQFFARLATTVPENVQVVPSDDQVSSYSIMAIAEVGLIWHSITGLEMACMGKQVARSGGWFLAGKPFLTALAPGDDFDAVLDRCKRRGTVEEALERARLALRCAFVWYFRQALPLGLARQDAWFSGAYDFTDPTMLMPGRSPELDRIAEILLGETPQYLPPSHEERVRTTEAEDAFLRRTLITEAIVSQD